MTATLAMLKETALPAVWPRTSDIWIPTVAARPSSATTITLLRLPNPAAPTVKSVSHFRRVFYAPQGPISFLTVIATPAVRPGTFQITG